MQHSRFVETSRPSLRTCAAWGLTALIVAFGLFWLFRWLVGPAMDKPLLMGIMSFVSVALGSLLVWISPFLLLVGIAVYLHFYAKLFIRPKKHL